MNGKSGNINNVCSQMYPPGTRVPGSELICVFDADQVASKEFFMKTIPMFDGGTSTLAVCQTLCGHTCKASVWQCSVSTFMAQPLALLTALTAAY